MSELGLRYDLPPTGAVARTEDGWVLRTGLGALGVGSMWQSIDDEDDRDYSAVPIDPEARDGFGMTAAESRDGVNPWDKL